MLIAQCIWMLCTINFVYAHVRLNFFQITNCLSWRIFQQKILNNNIKVLDIFVFSINKSIIEIIEVLKIQTIAHIECFYKKSYDK
jgi:hypothetical protein